MFLGLLQQVVAQSLWPFALWNFSKFLDRINLSEASAILVHPNGMKLLGHLNIFKSLGHNHFQLIWCNYVSAPSKSPFLAIMTLSTASAIYLHPNEVQICRDDHLSMWSSLEISFPLFPRWCPTTQHKHLAAGLLLGHLQISSLPLDQIISSVRLRALRSIY